MMWRDSVRRGILRALCVLCLGAGPAVAGAEVLSGVLEKGRSHTVLFSFSPESGDLIGFVARNGSVAGQKLGKGCLVGMPCELRGVVTRPFEGQPPADMKDQPSGWIEIVSFRDSQVQKATAVSEQAVRTRHGLLKVDEESRRLLFKGRPVLPEVEGNAGLFIVAHHEAGNADVLLLENVGGTACPALYRFVTVRQRGVEASPEFGTCSDLIYPVFDGKRRFAVRMVGFLGPFEPESRQRRAARQTVLFEFDSENGRMWENGRPLR